MSPAILADSHSLRSQESYRRPVLIGFGILLGAVLVTRLGFEAHRLMFDPRGPVDLLLLRELIRDWFADVPVYVDGRGAVHPPASFLLLWPLYGWVPRGLDRWFFVLVTAAVTAAMVAILLREARPAGRAGRLLIAALVAGCYPAAISFGNGQMTMHLLLAAIVAVLVALREPPTLRRDLALGALSLFALVKPNLTVPFFWVIAFRPGWTRPVAFALLGYLAASAVSIALHGTGLEAVRALVEAWYRKGEAGFAFSGYANLHTWLGDIGLRSWILPASGAVFALHGLWAWRHRGADPWIAIGVAAIVARLWAYHQVYDDLLLIFPLIALYRLAGGSEHSRGAAILFALSAVMLAAPITPVVERAAWALVALWLAQLVFLAAHAREPSRSRSAGLVSAERG
ncbi:MAG TPA: glycosyltransferase 87 family protein [Gemmatimonadota bacterium]